MPIHSSVRTLAADDSRTRTLMRWAIPAAILSTAAVLGVRAHANSPTSSMIAGPAIVNVASGFAPTIADAPLDLGNRRDARLAELSDQEYFSYSGVGALICTINGQKQTSTAFLVGSFDLAVTVAHTLVSGTTQASPSDCVYTSTDSTGQIRERLPVAYYKSQWIEAHASGVPAKDLAVVRLSQRSSFAHRTLPLGKFSGASAPVTMIGFTTEMETDTFKRKSRGTVYERDTKSKRARTPAVADIFSHDMDALELASGAPVLDERSGVIIGVHTSLLPSTLQATAEHTAVSAPPTARNALITMNPWLEATLRAEILLNPPVSAEAAAAP
jgi:V8-like Glu-specific endopeptidase